MIKEEIGNPELDYLFDTEERCTENDQKLKEIYLNTIKKMPKIGEVVSGNYVGVNEDHYTIDVVGYKDYVRIENKPYESKYLSKIEKGDEVEVMIVDKGDNKNFIILGSISQLYETLAHDKLKSLDKGSPVLAEVISINPAGYDLEIIHGSVTLPGFMPNTLAGINKLHDPESIIGDTFNVHIESYSDSEKTYIVSRKAYLKSLINEEMSKLDYGTVYTGNVTGTAKFGVFVEFGVGEDTPVCLTGMIHRVNLNPEWQDRISEIKPGFEIDFYVKDIIEAKRKIILTQVLRESIWDTIEPGQRIDGTITDIKPFGVLVKLDEETIGLIHSSETHKIKGKIEKGEEINVKILAADRNTRKIFLTI